jgi:hypothetical protein
MSESLKPVGFQKARVVAICAKTKPIAMIAAFHDRRSSQLLRSEGVVVALRNTQSYITQTKGGVGIGSRRIGCFY